MQEVSQEVEEVRESGGSGGGGTWERRVTRAGGHVARLRDGRGAVEGGVGRARVGKQIDGAREKP